MEKCNLCARHCNIERKNATGFCGTTDKLKIALADLFFWEEPVISGKNGSGAIFFSGCNLKCVFCQNYKISSLNYGKEITVERLAQIFKELEEKGANNINLVTPTHYINQIVSAFQIYRPKIPIVYNTNSYESDEGLNKIAKYVDIFLPDLKYYSKTLSKTLSSAPNYFEIATKNILKMVKLQPKVEINELGIMQKGVIIRHLVLPNCTDDSIKILEWIEHNAPNALVSVMGQYTPYFKACEFELINRKLTPLEYKVVLNKAQKLNLKGFEQELESATQNLIPNFDLKGV